MLKLLTIKSLLSRKLTSFLCLLSLALSLTLFLLVEKMRNGVEEGFTNTISNADLIVGARSGPLQLLLYTIFHMGSATNNIRYSSYESIKKIPVVDWTIPISLGDSYKGHRVVATDQNFFNHYQFYGDKKIALKEGRWIQNTFDVTLGSLVARKQNLKLGDALILSHGISDKAILEHKNSPFKVVGVMKPTGTPLDKSVFITLPGMEAIHIGWETGAPSGEKIDYAHLSQEKLKTTQLTSFILRTKNRIALLRLQRYINTFEAEPLMGIVPGLTLSELWSVLDQLEKAFLGVSFFVIIIGFLSVLISLYMSLDQRSREMAILRSLGVSPFKITTLLLTEAIVLSVMGALMGVALHYLIILILNPILETQYSLSLPLTPPGMRELWALGLFILLGIFSGIVPALKAYRSSLHNGLLIK